MLIKLKKRLLIRRGMTLVELLVVMSIMVTFAAMTAAFYPSISSDNQIAQASNKIQNLLVGARQKARRDNNVTGVRFFPDLNNSSAANQMMLVQKPVDLTGSSLGANIVYSPPNIVSFLDNIQKNNPTILDFEFEEVKKEEVENHTSSGQMVKQEPEKYENKYLKKYTELANEYIFTEEETQLIDCEYERLIYNRKLENSNKVSILTDRFEKINTIFLT